MSERLLAVVVYRIRVERNSLDAAWQPGPAPFPLPGNRSRDLGYTQATTEYRKGVVLDRVATRLYGTTQEPRRFHLTDPSFDGDPGLAPIPEDAAQEWLVTGSEVLLLSGGGKATPVPAVAMLHLRLAPGWDPDKKDGRSAVGLLKAWSRDLWRRHDDLQSGPVAGWCLPAEARPWLPQGSMPEPGWHDALVGLHLDTLDSTQEREAVSDWTERDQWRWSLAMVSPPTPASLRDPQRPPNPGREIYLPKRRVTIVRAGVLIESRHGAWDQQETDVPASLFRTIYADGLILAAAQGALVEDVANQTSLLEDPVSTRRAFGSVAQAMRSLRNAWWFRSYTVWDHPDHVFRELQEESGLVRQYEELQRDHEYFAQTVQASESSAVNRVLLFLAVLGVFGVLASILAVIDVPLSSTTTAALLVAGTAMSATFAWIFYRRR